MYVRRNAVGSCRATFTCGVFLLLFWPFFFGWRLLVILLFAFFFVFIFAFLLAFLLRRSLLCRRLRCHRQTSRRRALRIAEDRACLSLLHAAWRKRPLRVMNFLVVTIASKSSISGNRFFLLAGLRARRFGLGHKASGTHSDRTSVRAELETSVRTGGVC